MAPRPILKRPSGGSPANANASYHPNHAQFLAPAPPHHAYPHTTYPYPAPNHTNPNPNHNYTAYSNPNPAYPSPNPNHTYKQAAPAPAIPPAPRAAVHFPPSPALTRTFACHSAAAYDRSPIVVTPNSCALPERGGRTYLETDADSTTGTAPRGIKYARDYHPRALAFASSASSSDVPPLMHDLSSESDESDGVSCLPAQIATHAFAAMSLSSTSPSGLSLSPSKSYHDRDFDYDYPAPSSPEKEKAHRRRGSRDARASRHESSADPDRIPGHAAAVSSSPPYSSYPYSSSFSPSSSPTSSGHRSSSTSPRRKKGVRSSTSTSGMLMPTQTNATAFGMPEEGCLGGF